MSIIDAPGIYGSALAGMVAPERTALALIDLQVDFIGPQGAAGRRGIDCAAFEPPLGRIEKLLAAARARGVTPLFIRVITRPETDADALVLLHARRGLPTGSVALCRAGSPGADYYRVRPNPGEIEIEKPLFSSFVKTDLDATLRARGIDTLVIAGFTTDCCVDCTARDAFHRNYSVFVVADACAAYDEDLHRGALNGLAKNCALLTDTASVVSAWS